MNACKEKIPFAFVNKPAHLQTLAAVEHRRMSDYDAPRPRSNSLSRVKSSLTPGLARSSSFKKKVPVRNPWGTKTYAELISEAISASKEKRLSLSEIYEWIVANVAYFKDKAEDDCRAGWKNSIRHNLSLHDCFVRIVNAEMGKSSWWTVNTDIPLGKSTTRRRSKSNADKLDKSLREQARRRAEILKNSATNRANSGQTNVTEYPSNNNFDQGT